MFPQTPSHSLAYSHGLAEINWRRANKMVRGRREGGRERERERERVPEGEEMEQ